MSESQTTLFYFSGEQPIENFMRDRPELFDNCGILLSFYHLGKSKKGRPGRRLTAIIKGKKYKRGKRLKKVPVKNHRERNKRKGFLYDGPARGAVKQTKRSKNWSRSKGNL